MVRLATTIAVALAVCLSAVATSQAAPDVNNHAGAASVAPGQARLQGKLVGGGDADVVVYWGPTGGGTATDRWLRKSRLKGVKNATAFSVTADKLIYGQVYFYRCYATNASGGAWAPTTARFTTLKPTVPAPGAGNRPVLTVKSGLVCWFDAAVGVTTDNKGVVQTWKDLSGNGHDGYLAAGAPVLAANQVNSRPAIQFRTASGRCGLNLQAPLFVGEQYVVVRSPNAAWNNDGCFLGRRWKRASSYRLSRNTTRFWGDQYPKAVWKNGRSIPEQPFDFGPITEYMILKIGVNDGDMSRNTYQIAMADSASCDCDIAEILGFQTPLSPADDALVGGYLAAKYGIATAYRVNAGMAPASTLTNSPATATTPTSATLNATLTCPGSVYDVRVYWGTVDGGTDAGLWENSAPVGKWSDVASTRLRHTITGLTPGVTYYFTFRGTNAVDSLWAGRSFRFRAGGSTIRPTSPKLPVAKDLVCWFDAGVGVTADNKGAVQTWKDLSGRDHHARTGGGVAAILASDQIGSRSAVQFRKGWLALDGTLFAKEQYLVIRSPGPRWSGAGGLLGRLKGRGSSYNTWGYDTGFWQDQAPAAVSRDGTVLPGPAFDCSPLTRFMILKVVVNDRNETEAVYAIGNNDGLSSCDFDVAEILGYRSMLSPADEALVGGYLATKYGIDTAYPPLPQPGAKSAELPPGEMAAVKYKSWQYSGSLYLLTTPEGADLPASASEDNFPVLVRLDKDFFDFSQARPDGGDIRFATSTGVPMAYQIDRWDAAAGTASIWVRVPRIQGNARQEIRTYWGRADAGSESGGPAVFNKSNGYVSVWHMNDPVRDATGTVESADLGTTPSSGMIGRAKHFAGGKGINCGEHIRTYPFASSPHTSEAWLKADRFNTAILSWGKNDGVSIRVTPTPARISIDTGRTRIPATSMVPKSQWVQLVYAYNGQTGQVYVNGRLDAAAPSAVEILTPVRMQIGAGFFGDLDEVRISKVARSPDWVKLQYENQKPLQTLVGPLVQPGSAFSVSQKTISLLEGNTTTVTARAGGAQKVYWIIKRGGKEAVAAVDRFHFTLDAGRVTGDQSFTLQFKAVYAGGVKALDIPVTVRETIPEPLVTLKAPRTWDGRTTIEVEPILANQDRMRAAGADKLSYTWDASGMATITEVRPGKLVLNRAMNSGKLTVRLAVDNGGQPARATATILVTEPAKDEWVHRKPAAGEMPEDGAFYARDDTNTGTLYCSGKLAEAADSVFLRVYCDEKLYHQATQDLSGGKAYSLSAKLKAGLVKYRIEFGSRRGLRETILHKAGNIVCGDAYLIEGQSNALATDTGEKSPPDTNDWIRSYGGPTGRGDATHWVRDRFGKASGSEGPRPNLWCNPVWKAEKGEKAELGWWGMELAKRLVASQKIPIFIINGAVGGTRIDEHQPSPGNHADLKTIYGRMLWRVQQARLTHGIRAVIWHQGESDQGADGPTDGYGWETYQQYFLSMSAAWQQDFPNIRHYYVFQIWPNSCSMGNGHGDMLREVQRTLPRLYSNMSIMSTLGIRPPGPCHYPLTGWAEFARLLQPMIERDIYGKVPTGSLSPPDLRKACYTTAARDEIALEFDQPVVWHDALTSQFYLDGKAREVASGRASGRVIILKLKAAAAAKKITYLEEMHWNQDNLLVGSNGIAAMTFCDVPILPRR